MNSITAECAKKINDLIKISTQEIKKAQIQKTMGLFSHEWDDQCLIDSIKALREIEDDSPWNHEKIESSNFILNFLCRDNLRRDAAALKSGKIFCVIPIYKNRKKGNGEQPPKFNLAPMNHAAACNYIKSCLNDFTDYRLTPWPRDEPYLKIPIYSNFHRKN